VLFPAPEGPKNPKISPRSISKFRFFKTAIFDFGYVYERFSTLITTGFSQNSNQKQIVGDASRQTAKTSKRRNVVKMTIDKMEQRFA
jgi:leucyl-tRNA synthetase